MPDTDKAKTTSTETSDSMRIPLGSLAWLVIGGILFLMGTQVVTLRDQERFVADFELQKQTLDTENTIQLDIVAGTYEYEVEPRILNPVEVGEFAPDTDHPVASRLFANIPDVTSVVIEPQMITITYDNDIEADLMLRRANRPVSNAVLNDNTSITGAVSDDAEQTLVYTTTDEVWLFGRYVPSLIPDGAQEVYATRDEGLSGSELAQFIFARVTAIEALTINPDSLIVTYRDGAVEDQLINRVTDALNDYHPRASLSINVWLFSINPSGAKVLEITPIDTGIPLIFLTLFLPIVEIMTKAILRERADDLVLPIVRVIGIFFFFWSIYGHEPLWDYVLANLFPTSAQLVHPNATVIEFTAQHLELVFVSSLITVPMGLLIGVMVTRDSFREILPLVNNLVNSGQTVPTIAIVAFMAPIIGFGFWPAIIALVAYGLLPVVRNTIAGLEAVDDFVIDSARGMGMTPAQILFRIELPIASSIIMAGIRTSMVINVGTATLGAFVGSGGLGTPIASGLSMTIDSFILLGAIPAALLAILIDYVLGRIEFVITPRGLQIEK
jgi:osmoprotectant transport system permease protein